MKHYILSAIAIICFGLFSSPSSAQYTVSYTSDGFSVYSGGKVVYTTTETPDYVDFTYHNEPFDMWYDRIGDTQTTYESICIRGSWDGWSADKPMTLCPMVYNIDDNAVESHIWKTEIESDGTIEFKFKTPGDWETGTNWGGSIDDVFPYGNAWNDGYNIRVPAGKWIVLFNDIDLSYALVSKQ